jgi:anti-sigma factor RsiW
MTTVHDDSRFDSIAVLAIGALPPAEARDLEAHIAECELCRREYDELRGAVDALAFSAEVTPEQFGGAQCARLRDRVMSAVRASAPASVATLPTTARIVPLARRGVPAWAPYLAAAAALVLAVYSTWNLTTSRTENDSYQKQIALLQARIDAQEHAANEARAQLALEESRLADLIAPGAARFAVRDGVVVRSGGRILIALRHLPALPKGKTYQAWTLRRGAKSVSPSITFAPDPTGLALVELPESAANVAAVAVSVEPEGGSKQPTSKPNFVRPLS